MGRRNPLLSALVCGVLLCGASAWGCAPTPNGHPTPAPVQQTAPAGPDYLVVTPGAFRDALEPLIAHRRAQGYRPHVIVVEEAQEAHHGTVDDPAAIHGAIRRVYDDGQGALRYLLIVGDVPRSDEPPSDRVATYYLDKLSYDAQDSYHRERHVYHRSLLRVDEDERAYPSDYPYAVMRAHPGVDADADLRVGRVPARTTEEVAGFVDKLIRYETRKVEGTWPRRIVVRGGPARFGAAIDRLIEQTALDMLDQDVPYRYDVDVVFAKEGSEYSYRFDKLGQKLVDDANRGAFLMAYVGHSSPAYFDTTDFRGMPYPIGSRHDFERMQIDQGAPIFLSLSCDVGAFDMSSGRRSIAEEAVLNPGGPIAAFASSRVSHPYPNLLYGEAFLEHFLVEQPTTLGDGIDTVKRALLTRSNLLGEMLSTVDTRSLKREHLGLYNLFGDPATRLRYPKALELTLADEQVAPGAQIGVTLGRSAVHRGKALVTLETTRSTIQRPLVAQADIDAMPHDEALAAIADNHQRAVNKRIVENVYEIADAGARFSITAPDAPGRFVLKVFANGTGPDGAQEIAWGHAFIEVQ